jgi:hypothetical protein
LNHIDNNPKLKLISSKNQGCGAARKTGILASSNSILVFDCDIKNIDKNDN